MQINLVRNKMENHLLLEVEEEYSPIARLIEFGRQKKYVTFDDILHFFPEAEKVIEQLEEAFSALLSAGVAFVEDITASEPPDNELVTLEEPETGPEPELLLDDYLANIDIFDTVGLYIKEVSQVPLLARSDPAAGSNCINSSKTVGRPASTLLQPTLA